MQTLKSESVYINDLEHWVNKSETVDRLTLAKPNMYALNTAEYLLTQQENTHSHDTQTVPYKTCMTVSAGHNLHKDLHLNIKLTSACTAEH